MRNIEKTIEETIVKTGYDMKVDEVVALQEKGACESICNAFVFGYAQGMKALKAEMKQKGVAL
ncbi:hypothetical protein [Amedibacillus dolichus]|uniref:Uncharacterized protein n=1 Tax=Amedibacillus dolichus DSM 3991 TaxID=428127 RepID=A8RCX9_9FIRM|nr:hypothetical protein [Amedibacillus dolichus]EDP10933.1 hypothetical protein EUBDOL_01532 [Amedibacillus dolichus DSM 3991]